MENLNFFFSIAKIHSHLQYCYQKNATGITHYNKCRDSIYFLYSEENAHSLLNSVYMTLMSFYWYLMWHTWCLIAPGMINNIENIQVTCLKQYQLCYRKQQTPAYTHRHTKATDSNIIQAHKIVKLVINSQIITSDSTNFYYCLHKSD